MTMQLKKINLHRLIVMISIIVMTSCATPEKETYIVPSINKRILIISGESLNSSHDDPRINTNLLRDSTKFSESLRDELKKRGAIIIERINNDAEKTTGRIISELLAEINFDAVIQISIIYEITETRNEMDLTASYIPLLWSTSQDGESKVKAIEASVKNYKDVADLSISQLALEYTRSLIAERVF